MTSFWFFIILHALVFTTMRKKRELGKGGGHGHKDLPGTMIRPELPGFSQQSKSPCRHGTGLKAVVYRPLQLHTQPPTGTVTVPEGQGYHLRFPSTQFHHKSKCWCWGCGLCCHQRNLTVSRTSVTSLGRKISSLFFCLFSSYYVNLEFGHAGTFFAASDVKTLKHKFKQYCKNSFYA